MAKVLRKRLHPVAGVAIAGFLAGYAPMDALAAASAASLAVSANVNSACATTSNSLPFGTYSGSQLRQTASISVTCTNTTYYNLGLDAGTTAGATVSSRKLSDGSGHTLRYALYQDGGYSSNWGNTIGTDTQSGTGTGSAQTLTVYGQIAGGQTPVAGRYTDTITAVVTY